jgi:hypothetical protein
VEDLSYVDGIYVVQKSKENIERKASHAESSVAMIPLHQIRDESDDSRQ